MIPKRNQITDLVERKILLTDAWYQLISTMLKSVKQNLYGKRVLEVGCGFGGFCIKLAMEGANPVGLDISSFAIRKAKDLTRKYGIQADFVVGDAQFLPFRKGSSEIVICSETLEHVENYELTFRELIRVTQKSGHLCVTVPNLLSTLFFQYIILLTVGQPRFVKEFFSVEREHIFHLFKVRKLFSRADLKIVEIRSADILHLPPRIRKALKIDHCPPTISGNLEFHNPLLGLGLFGATIGVVAKKK